MFSIHRVVLQRLLAAWLIVSVVVGLGVYYLETVKMDEYVVSLATSRAAQFSPEGVEHGRDSSEQLARLQLRAQLFASQHFAVIEVYDRNKALLVQAVNPRHADIERTLQQYPDTFPRHGENLFKKYDIDRQTVVQVLTPLKTRSGEVAGFFEGVYVVDPQTLANLHNQLIRTLAVTLVAVLLTAVVFYPVIIGLNRHLIRASRDILRGNLEMAAALGEAIAKRDWDTGEHNFRVTLYAIRLGEAVGVRGIAMRHLMLGAFLHDVGKIGISDRILLKDGALTDEEFAIMRSHVSLGVDIIGKSDWLRGARNVIAYHHEKFDGSGYLDGLAGEAIPLNARIFAIVDVFDALTSRRPYKLPWPVEKAVQQIESEAGRHFDPALVAAFKPIAPGLYAGIGQSGEAELTELLREQAIRYFLSPPVSDRR